MPTGSDTDNAAQYYAQNLGQVWTFPGYQKYESVPWHWYDLPFSDRLDRRELRPPRVTRPIRDCTILEVGSAMGSAYSFLKDSALVDTRGYVGIEISDMGCAASKQRFPEATWIQADFTRYELQKRFDYAFERVAVHHMPHPLRQFEKMLRATERAMMTTFRGCLRGHTVSDLSKGFFRTREEKYFCNIINLFELIELGLDLGFRHVRVMFLGLHEPIGADPDGYHYLDPAVAAEGRLISRFQVRFSRLENERRPLIYATTTPKVALRHGIAFLRLTRALSKLSGLRAFSRL